MKKCILILYNSNIPPAFCFRFCYFYSTLDNLNNVLSTWQVRKKNGVSLYKSMKYWVYSKTTVSILCYHFFRHCSSNSMTILVKCAWYLHSLLIFLLICFELLITDPLSRRLSYREWTVLSFFQSTWHYFVYYVNWPFSMHRSNNIKNISEVWEFIGMCLCFQFNICQKNCASPKTDFDLMTCKL